MANRLPLSEARQVVLIEELLTHIKTLRGYKRVNHHYKIGLSISILVLIVSVVACVVVCVTSKNKHHSACIETSNLRIQYTCLQDLNKRLTSDVERLTSDLEHVQTTNNSSGSLSPTPAPTQAPAPTPPPTIININYNQQKSTLEQELEQEERSRARVRAAMTTRDSIPFNCPRKKVWVGPDDECVCVCVLQRDKSWRIVFYVQINNEPMRS